MLPGAVRQRWPEARFVARARIQAEPSEINPDFAGALEQSDGLATVWGIAVDVIRTVEGTSRAAITDAGEPTDVIVAELPLLAGSSESVLSASLYWELTPTFTTLLREAAGVAAPAAEGGWESPVLEAEPTSQSS